MTVDAVNLLACLDAWRRERPEQLAVIGYDVKRSRNGGRPVRRHAVTTEELWREVLAAATGLYALGIRSGDLVAVQLPNWKEYLVAHLAAYALGAITTPISPILRQRDVSRQLEIGRAAALVVPTVFGGFDYAGMARDLQAKLDLRCVIAVGAAAGEGVVGWDAMLRDGAADTLAALREAIARGDFVRSVDEVTVVNFSSGTSGEPKGVMHSTKTIASCIVPCIDVLQLTADDILVVVPTLGHGSGILNGLYLPLLLRASVVYLDAWDAEVALRVIERERVTYGPVMPTYLFDLAALHALGDVDVSSWKTGRVSGGAIPRGIMKTIQERLPGLRLCPGWGMSETFWSTCGSPSDPPDKRNATDGRCVGDCRIEIRDATCTRELPIGEVGDIVLRSSALMLGYYRQDELTRNCFTADGWFKTGDLGRVDEDGYLTIAGRSKDLVIRGGENVPVVEVEALLMGHPKVKGVAVVGVPDARLGEKVCAVIEARDASQPLSFDEMTQYLADKQLTRHFIPQHLLLVDELPRTPVGKLMKQRVREEAARRLATPDAFPRSPNQSGEPMTQATDARASETDVLLYEVRDKVAYLTIARERSMNALNPKVLEQLARRTDQATADTEVKAIVIRGQGGKAFSAGVDLKHFHDQGVIGDVGTHLLFTAQLRDLFIKIEKTPLPIIAVVQGYALAGGLELALACDFIVCTHDSRIGDQHANYGLMAGGGGTQRLPRRIGQQRAMELLFTGRRLDGREAVQVGLALASYADEELDAGVEGLLAQLRNKSRIGMGFMKSTVQRGIELPLREALDIERLVVQEYFSCYGEAGQGVTDFNQKKRTSEL